LLASRCVFDPVRGTERLHDLGRQSGILGHDRSIPVTTRHWQTQVDPTWHATSACDAAYELGDRASR
jgi:hypothetical protein